MFFFIFKKSGLLNIDDLYDNQLKFLADIVEAVIGAIYVDADLSLKVVSQVLNPIFKPYLGNYTK